MIKHSICTLYILLTMDNLYLSNVILVHTVRMTSTEATNNDFVSMCGYFVNNKIMWRMYPYLANVHFIHTDNDNDCINDFIWLSDLLPTYK